ncbi:MAG: hypothetical protein ABIG61_08635, partial [Planctomycetota bacterium]
YNKIIGYNRCDLNLYCCTIVIGDGPANLFRSGGTAGVFLPLLAKLRTDYSPAAFFYDPFLHYQYEERANLQIDNIDELPQDVPKRLADGFTHQNLTVKQIRFYFRAANIPPGKKDVSKAKRLEELSNLILKSIERFYPKEQEKLKNILTPRGCEFPGEQLRLNTYPFYFEDTVFEIMQTPSSSVS